MPADFHIHSQFSDGTYSIEDILRVSQEEGLTSIALTDHDTVSGLKEILEKSSSSEIIVVPGIELSSVYEGEDVHILGLGIDFNNGELLSALEYFQEKRRERLLKIIECLQEAGFELNENDFSDFNFHSESIGRVHVAEVLKRKGFVSSVSEAFELWLSRKSPCFKEKFIVTPFEQIKLIERASGLPVLAHPGDYSKKVPLVEMVKAGLKGIEAFHPDHKSEQIKAFLDFAEEHSLVVTGGSDAHGPGSERGYNIGFIKLPDSYEKRVLEVLGLSSSKNA